MELLHTYSDGSKLYKMPVRALVQIPIWKGNRIIDHNHVSNIQQSIKSNIATLDSGYKIVQYTEYDVNNQPDKKSCIIDGQHRVSVLMDHFERNPDDPDFFVTVTQIRAGSEADVIEYFNTINNVKPIQFEEDKNLVVNKYIMVLCKEFNNGIIMIRAGTTRRPYLSLEKLREALMKRYHKLKGISADTFVKRCVEVNQQTMVELHSSSDTTTKKALQLEFTLALDERWKWLDRVLSP